MRLRFAPSPTGHLHVGNARTALFNWLLARGRHGTFVLRIEDTDRERSTADSERAILDDLRWLGLDWDEGPDRGGPYGPYRQSERASVYDAKVARLLADGRAYSCFCTPERLDADRQAALAAGTPPRYNGRCRAVSAAEAASRRARGESAAIRFRVPDGVELAFEDLVRGRIAISSGEVGDPVLVRSDGTPAYNFAVVVDDAGMAITDVIRGEDHISNTFRQILIYEALGVPPPRFAHVSLVLGPDHAPLSKRHGATSVAEFRAKGYLPEALVNYLALIGWSPGGGEELLPLEELARRFSLETVSRSAGVFDEEKLAWVNRHYLKLAAPPRLAALSLPYLREAGMVRGADAGPALMGWIESVVPMATGSVDRLSDVPSRLHLVFSFDAAASASREAVRAEFEAEGPRAVARALAGELSQSPRLLDRDAFRALAQRVRGRTGEKGRGLFHPIRVVLTGEAEGPELDLLVPAIERAAELPPGAGLAPVTGCRERAAAFVAALGL